MNRRLISGTFAALALGITIAACSSSSHSSGGGGQPNSGSASASSAGSGQGSSQAQSKATTTTSVFGPPPTGTGNLQPGSDPSVLPGPLLIADRSNDRLLVVDPQGRIIWQFPRTGDLGSGQVFTVPDDAFFTPDGRQIVATQEDNFQISVIDIATHRVTYSYGTPGVSGESPNHLWNPDDAIQMPNGNLILADIKNCRILVIGAGQHEPAQVIGHTVYPCLHDPPNRFGSPNGAFPMENGHYVITEINGDWVDEMSLDGKVYNAVHPPGISYPSDTNEVSPGVYLVADYSTPGTIETFDASGKLLWKYAPSGSDRLANPSLALPLPNGDVVANDDHNHRVIVVDPRSNRIVWQYGVTSKPGSDPGLLNNPDGVDLAPPYSLAVTHAASMGVR